jgi:DNA-binding transcriptional MerR regulator
LDKAPDAFRTISEVADDLDVPQHVLRFWETRFAQIKPMKRSGGRRYYRPDDVDLLRGIRQLLYGEGYTIRGVQRILREQGIKTVQNVMLGGTVPPPETADADEDAAEAEVFDEAEDTPEPRLEASVVPLPRSEASRLSRDDIRKLEAAIHEMTECRRLLDDVLKP